MADTQRNLAPRKLELLVTVVDYRRAQYYVNLIQSFDVNMQLVVQAKGTAQAEILDYLGLSDSPKAVIFSLVREDRLNDLAETLEEKFTAFRGSKGVAAAVPLTSVIGAMIYGFLCGDKRTVKEGGT